MDGISDMNFPNPYARWQPQIDLVAKAAKDLTVSNTGNGWDGTQLAFDIIRLETEVKILKMLVIGN